MRIQPCNDVQIARYYIGAMLREHFKEVGNTAVYELAPDWDKYEAIHEQGNLVVMLAFDKTTCVGYTVGFLTPHIHYQNQKVCYNDVIYLSPEYRGGTGGARLMKAMEADAKKRGAVIMQYHAKPGTALDIALASRKPLFEKVYASPL